MTGSNRLHLHDEAARRRSRWAGLGYGLIYSLAYGLSAWGIDAWVLARSHAELAWAKLEIGLPLVLFIGALTGVLAGRSKRAGTWVGAWMVGGALMGIVVGGMPFAGQNLATWIAEPRLWGANVYPLGPAEAKRMAFVTAVTGCAGSAVGLVGHLVMERARGLASPPGRTSGRPWAALALGLPLAVLPGLLGDELINKPLRAGPRAVYEALSTSPVGNTGPGDAAPFRDELPAGYTLHLVDYDLETEAQQTTIDVASDDGLIWRCQVSGRALGDCLPIWPELEAWMDGLIEEGRQGGQGTALGAQANRLSVDGNWLSWLASRRAYLSGRYEISRDTQHGRWVIIAARFDSGYVLTCYFRGVAPVILDHCSGNQ